MGLLRFDYVSDLHIDYWDKQFFPQQDDGHHLVGEHDGSRKHFPTNWGKIKNKSDILVVAGDISDRLDVSLKYLEALRKYYPIILFVDGNHEHTHFYPDPLPPSKFKVPEGIHYLRHQDYVVGKTVFIGTCGWWDYENTFDPEKVEKTVDQQKSYIKMLGKDTNRELAKNLILKSKDEYQYIIDRLEKYSRFPEIDEIVIVTHTVPKKEFAQDPVVEYNGWWEKISDRQLQEYGVSRWIYGHSHDGFHQYVAPPPEEDPPLARQVQEGLPPLGPLGSRIPAALQKVDPLLFRNQNLPPFRSLHYLSNPRGRPGPSDPWDREVYSIETTGTVPVSEACKL